MESKVNSSGSFNSNSVSKFYSTADVKSRYATTAKNVDAARNIDNRDKKKQIQENLIDKYRQALGDFGSSLKDGTIAEIRDNSIEKGLEKGGKFIEKKLSKEVVEEVSEGGLRKAVGKVGGAVAKKAGPIATVIGAALDFKDKIEEGKSVKRSLIEVVGGVAGGAVGGVLAGAVAGAVAGSVVPGVGNVIGGIAGAVLGGIAGEAVASKSADLFGIK